MTLPKNYKNNRLLELPKEKYTREQLDKVFELLDQNLHAQEIALQVPGISARQIKLIRFVKTKGEPKDINDLYTCKYFISRIKDQIQLRKIKKKVFEEKFGKYPGAQKYDTKRSSSTKTKKHSSKN